MEIAFENQIVLVTGAARGVGQALCTAFCRRGAQVHASDILEPELELLNQSIQCDRGGSIQIHPADITDEAKVAGLIKEIQEFNAGRSLDIVVCAAGGIVGQQAKPIDEVTQTDWLGIIDVNITGVFNVVKAVVPGMKKGRAGQIVVISSPAGLRTSLTGIQSYALSKAGQIGLVRQLAQELGPHGIRVNSVAPGFMPTSPDYVRQWEGYGSAGQAALKERIALRRLCTPEDVAHAVMFLASHYAGFITGQTLPVNGTP